MAKIWEKHSLSIVSVGIFSVLTIATALSPEGYWRTMIGNMAGDAFGVSMIVILTKWLTEKDSAESK